MKQTIPTEILELQISDPRAFWQIPEMKPMVRIHHMDDLGWTVVMWPWQTPDDAYDWDDGYVVAFLLYEHCHSAEDGFRAFEEGGMMKPRPAELKNALPVLDGSIKWDSCMNIKWLESERKHYSHYCDPGQWRRVSEAIGGIWKLVAERLRNANFDGTKES